MRPLQILANTPEVRGHIQVVHPKCINDPNWDGEMKDELVEQNALPFLIWNYKEMIVDKTMVIYWLKCIYKPGCCKSKSNVLYVWSPWMELIEKLYKDENIKAHCKMME